MNKITPWVKQLDKWRDELDCSSWEQFADRTKSEYSRQAFSNWTTGKIRPEVIAIIDVSYGKGLSNSEIADWLKKEAESRRDDPLFMRQAKKFIDILERSLSADSDEAKIAAKFRTLPQASKTAFVNLLEGLGHHV